MGTQGSLAQQIARNARRIREAQGLHLADVSERMTALGQPLSLNAISKIERGNRGIDLDELAALARALDVPPLLLIFPIGHEPTVEVSPGQEVDTWDAVRWFSGDATLPAGLRSPVPSPGPFARLASWPDLAVREYRTHHQLCEDWLRADDDLRRAVGEDARVAADRRRGIENYLQEHRALMQATGLKCLPPVPAPLRAVLGDGEVRDGQH
ncbi:helix-turn-helix domain-containing protein [Modestobacter sp. VKM Ac-2978]|uniref:helix-turn-helix domain-containing protein n=1 Tax=Modestobacter sp. VKM Ac-2978 TaxID=3004132 RepID=UPI0022AA0273|nr:helix-turn-helix transcriptional regulator [Modestobacter sp. VKM Ac-2978]MCZ2850015.1 helix-turn-helix transcriptional regulator [Modestobacter sp. VKM Ac-2978]